MSGETTVGSIVGFLRLDADQFHREMERAIAESDALDGKKADVKVRADGAAKAQAELGATATQADRLDRSNVKLEQSSRNAGRGMGALATAVLSLGPAIVPLAAASVGLAAGFGAMGAAGVLAIVGIKHEMDSGTATGHAYGAVINTLKGDVNSLGQIAAKGVLGPFQQSVADLQTQMPHLTSMVGEFSSVTGKTAGNLTTGLIAAFVALEPLMRDVATYTFGLSQRFREMMTGPGVVSFGDYVRSVFPQVMSAVEALVGAAIHLVAALSPLGLGILSAITDLSSVISAIPVDVLATLATVAASVFVGFKSFSLINGMVEGVTGALVKMRLAEEGAAAGMATLNIAAAGIGTLVAVATFLYAQHAEAVRQDQQAVDDYTDALRQSNGAIDENIRLKASQLLADSGALAAARDLGYNLSDVTSAALGNADAIARVNTHTNDLRKSMAEAASSGGDMTATYGDIGGEIDKVTSAVSGNNKQLNAAIQKNKDQKAALDQTNGALSAQDAAQSSLAGRLGTTTTALQAATDGQKKTRDAAAAALAQMQLENNAADILRGSLDALNGKALSAADAQNAFDSSLANMGDHVTAQGKKIHFTTTSIENMSAASVQLRGQLNSQVSNLQRVVEANGGLANSTDKAKAEMVKMRQQIIDNAVAHGVDRKAVTDYIDKLLKVPAKIPPTKLDVDKAAAQAKLADVQRALDAMDGKTINVYTVAHYVDNGPRPGGFANQGTNTHGGSTKQADGGFITGPGSGRSDSIPAYLSNGEYVINADATSKHKGLLDSINAGKFANGGPVGFASGGAVNVPLSQWFSSYMSTLGSPVSKGDLVKDRALVAEATNKLHIAEMRLEQDRARRKSALQIARDEQAVAHARDSLATATTRLSTASANFAAQQRSLLGKFAASTAIGVRDAARFIANIEKLASRGYVQLAQQLAAMGGPEAEAIAAQAAGASTKSLNQISANVAKGAVAQNQLAHIDAITAILGMKGNMGARALSASSGIDVMELLDAAGLIRALLKGNKNASNLLGDLAKRSSGHLFASGGLVRGAGSGTSDSINARLSNGEFVVNAAATSRNRGLLDALNGGGTVELGDATVARIAAAMSRIQVRPVVSSGQFDSAMAVNL